MDAIRESIYFKNKESLSTGKRLTPRPTPTSTSYYKEGHYSIWYNKSFEFSASIPESSKVFLVLEMRVDMSVTYDIVINGNTAISNQHERSYYDKPVIRNWDITKHLGTGENEVKIQRVRGNSYIWSIGKISIDIVPPTNTLQINSGGYVSIPYKSNYRFGTGAFSAMAYITPKKVVEGKTVLKEGTIFSSKPERGGSGYGGWQLYLERDGEEHLLCFKTDDGSGYHLLKAPLNNLYDDKAVRNPGGAVADLAESQSLYKEYTHFVAAVREDNGAMSLYVNGYLLAKATPYSDSSSGMDTTKFQLKGIFKESIDQPTHFFTVKKSGTNYEVGYADWDSNAYTAIGSSFTLSGASKDVNVNAGDQAARGISLVNVGLVNEVPFEGMLASDKISLSIRPRGKSTNKLLAQFSASRASAENVNNSIGLNIGRTEQHTAHQDVFEGFIKHVSLWKRALSQQDIISYMDHERTETDSPDCIGLWKLANNFNDSSSLENHGSNNGDAEFIYKFHVLPVYVEEQQNSVWCWAASDLAVVEYYNPMSNVTQQQIVNTARDSNGGYMENNTNLVNESYTRCDPAPNWWKTLEQAIADSNDSFLSTFMCAPAFEQEIDFEVLRTELDKGNPMLVGVVWIDKGTGRAATMGHAMVLTGIIHKNDKNFLIINDPWSGIIYITIEDFAGGKYQSNGYWANVVTTTSNNQLT